MWRKPRIHELEAPPEFKNLINTSIFYNSSGRLSEADRGTIIQYLSVVLVSWSLMMVVVLGLTRFIVPGFPREFEIFFVMLTLLVVSIWFYLWGWKNYEQAWYHFDTTDNLFTVIRVVDGQWESIEIPFEQIQEVEWSGGHNGYAIIHAANFSFRTTRANSERFASVTEMWPYLARFDTKMSNWPITLICSECNREFGHHIGTAQCPFDEVMLIDPAIKGRIDPDDLHPDDQSRV